MFQVRSGSQSRASAVPAAPEAAPDAIAQLFVSDRPMMTTYGIGNAATAAETAEISLAFGTVDPMLTQVAETVTLLSEPMLAPIVAEIEALGIARDRLDVQIEPRPPGAYYAGQVEELGGSQLQTHI